MVLESRVYEQVPIHHMMSQSLLRTRKWARIAWTMFVKSVFPDSLVADHRRRHHQDLLLRWCRSSSPRTPPSRHATLDMLSRRMMRGTQVEVLRRHTDLPRLHILSTCTLGLTGIFYSNGYKASFWAEYYTYLRGTAKQAGSQGAEQLNTTSGSCSKRHRPICWSAPTPTPAPPSAKWMPRAKPSAGAPKGFAGWLADWFGIRIMRSKQVSAWEDYQGKMHASKTGRALLAAQMYPVRLPHPHEGQEHQHRRVERHAATRC